MHPTEPEVHVHSEPSPSGLVSVIFLNNSITCKVSPPNVPGAGVGSNHGTLFSNLRHSRLTHYQRYTNAYKLNTHFSKTFFNWNTNHYKRNKFSYCIFHFIITNHLQTGNKIDENWRFPKNAYYFIPILEARRYQDELLKCYFHK